MKPMEITNKDFKIEDSPETIELRLVPIVDGAEENPLVILSSRPVVKLGRVDDNDFILPIRTASRYHAQIAFKDGFFYLEDLNSSHGSFIGQQRLEPFVPVKLNHGDLIRFSTENVWYEVQCPWLEMPDEAEAFDTLPTQNDHGTEDLKFVKEFEQKGAFKPKWEMYLELMRQHGRSKKAKKLKSDGFNWGIVDEEEVYVAKDEDEVLDTHVLRLMPNLSDDQISKITEFEKKLRALHKVEKDLEAQQSKVQSHSEPQSKYENADYFEDEDPASISKSHGTDRNANTGTYKLWELRNVLNKKLSEVAQLEDQLKLSIFGKSASQRKIKDKTAYIENQDMIDVTETVSTDKKGNQVKDQSLDTGQMNSQQLKNTLAQLIKRRLFLEENLLSLSMQSSVSEFDLLDEYESFLAENKEINTFELKSHLTSSLEIVSSQIAEVYAKLKRLEPNTESLILLEQKIKCELESVISFLKKKQTIDAYRPLNQNELDDQDIDEVDFMDDEEEIAALNKRRKLQNESKQTAESLQNKKRIRSVGVASKEIHEDRIVEFSEPSLQKPAIGFSETDKNVMEEHFKKLGY